MRNLLSALFILISSLSSFAEVIEIDDIWDIKYNNRPMVVEAYASWCAPCRIYSPIMERLSREYAGKVDFYKVNIDNPDSEDFIIRYEVRAVPTTVFLWDPLGDASVKHSVERGLMSYDELKNCIENTISKQYKPTFSNNERLPQYKPWDNPSSDMLATASNDGNLNSWIGEWEGNENGSVTHFRIYEYSDEYDGNQYAFWGATDSPQREELVGTNYWILLGFEYDPSEDKVYVTDILPETPTNPSSMYRCKSGTMRERAISYNRQGDYMTMQVKEYKARDGHVDSTPSNQYTVKYTYIKCD